jgi:hypothetical protein
MTDKITINPAITPTDNAAKGIQQTLHALTLEYITLLQKMPQGNPSGLKRMQDIAGIFGEKFTSLSDQDYDTCAQDFRIFYKLRALYLEDMGER